MIVESYQDAKDKFLSGDFSVEKFFLQNGFFLEYGYCRLLSGDVKTALSAFNKILDYDFRADWAKKIIGFIEGNIISIPSYFQIRNFLEIDLNLLLKAGQAQFIENIINCADLLYEENPESYKFIARVMLYNDFAEIALYFLKKARDKFYYDPEMHVMLANCYFKQGDKAAAVNALNDCLSIMPEYLPAKKFLEKLI